RFEALQVKDLLQAALDIYRRVGTSRQVADTLRLLLSRTAYVDTADHRVRYGWELVELDTVQRRPYDLLAEDYRCLGRDYYVRNVQQFGKSFACAAQAIR